MAFIAGLEVGTLPSPIGEEHFVLPTFDGARRQSVKQIHDWSGKFVSDDGEANEIVSSGQHGFEVHFQLTGSSRNKVFISNCSNVRGKIGVTGSDNIVIVCGESPWDSDININHNGNNSIVFVGRGSTFGGLDLFPTGDGISLIIGEDCMFSHATMVRTYDQHTIFDLETREWVNLPGSVLIGPPCLDWPRDTYIEGRSDWRRIDCWS